MARAISSTVTVLTCLFLAACEVGDAQPADTPRQNMEPASTALIPSARPAPTRAPPAAKPIRIDKPARSPGAAPPPAVPTPSVAPGPTSTPPKRAVPRRRDGRCGPPLVA